MQRGFLYTDCLPLQLHKDAYIIVCTIFSRYMAKMQQSILTTSRVNWMSMEILLPNMISTGISAIFVLEPYIAFNEFSVIPEKIINMIHCF